MSELLSYLLNNEPQFRKNRLAALYSDFHALSTTNPDGYHANLLAWRTALSHACLAGLLPSPNRLCFTIDSSLLTALESKEWGRPLGLAAVVQDALARREWIGYKEFMDAKESVYHKTWIRIPGVGEVLYWTLQQLGLNFGADKLPTGQVVVLENLEKAGKEVMQRFEASPKGRVERIFSRKAFVETFGDVFGGPSLSEQDFVVLLKFLERDKGVLVYDSSTVKFLTPNASSPRGITNEDSTIAALKTLIRDLETQVSVLEKRVEVLNTTAKEAVERKNRVSALAALRSKKLAETTLGKRHDTLGRLEEVFSSIEQASDQVELVRVMEASSKVLSGLNKEVGGVERVEGVVERLREEMETVDEVGEIVAEGGRMGAVDEGEVDDELEVMEREERERREAVERKEREEREMREAEETRKRLDALEAIEREARDKENARKEAEANTEKEIEGSTLGMKRMSLDPPPQVSESA